MPTVSVLMPAYNAALYIREAIQSILDQTFDDYEFLICDDGSIDNTRQIMNSYNDSRIRFFQNDANQRLVKVRNKLWANAKGRYIAWMDADDISYSDRLQKQVDFLEKNSNIYAVSTYAHICDKDLNFLYDAPPPVSAPSEVLVHSFFRNCIVNTSVLMKNTKEFRYRKEYPPAEDYDLWSRILKKYEMAILPLFLVKYRVHDKSSSVREATKLFVAVKKICRNQLKHYGIDTNEWLEIAYQLTIYGYLALAPRERQQFSRKTCDYFRMIWLENKSRYFFDKKSLKYLIEFFFEDLISSLRIRYKLLFYFRDYPTHRIKGIYMGIYKAVRLPIGAMYRKCFGHAKKEIPV